MGEAMPRARALKRLKVGPSSAKMRVITRSSGAIWKLFSALAAALFTTPSTSLAAALGRNRKIPSASSTDLPRTASSTSRTFCGDRRTNFDVALTSISTPLLQSRRPLGVVAVAFVEAGEGELSQLVTHHILGDVHRYVAPAVVHADGMTHHIRRDAAVARPGLDQALLVPGVHPADLLLQVRIYIWSLFRRTCHLCSRSSVLNLAPPEPGNS